MATWKLSPQYKKSAVEKMFFYKEGKIITIEQGFRWATFSVESDERPLTDDELKNEDGYELGCIDNDESWEMNDMSDGCWCDIEIGNDKATSTDLEEFEAAWKEDWYSGVEALGWSNDDTEYYYYGPLVLTNEDTGEEFFGEKIEEDSVDSAPVTPVVESVVEQEPELTDWFPASINPVHKGTYQAINTEVAAWPFTTPEPVEAQWDGKKWNIGNILKWRGLANDPGSV
jgi:hypothetical protein